jgi:hypothetical protein
MAELLRILRKPTLRKTGEFSELPEDPTFLMIDDQSPYNVK